jgi:hypothetical protein
MTTTVARIVALEMQIAALAARVAALAEETRKMLGPD